VGQGAVPLWGFRGIIAISYNNLNTVHMQTHFITFLVQIVMFSIKNVYMGVLYGFFNTLSQVMDVPSPILFR
jgi:hypothetical protein